MTRFVGETFSAFQAKFATMSFASEKPWRYGNPVADATLRLGHGRGKQRPRGSGRPPIPIYDSSDIARVQLRECGRLLSCASAGFPARRRVEIIASSKNTVVD